ncbi:MAG: ATP-binding cassette domain-containing protein [Leifsonia sp.]
MTSPLPTPEPDKPTSGERASDASPAPEVSAATKPAVKKPAVKKAAVTRPAATSAVTTSPVTKPAAARKPAAKKPAAKKPLTTEPPATNPAPDEATTASKKPAALAAKKPAARKPAAVKKPAAPRTAAKTSAGTPAASTIPALVTPSGRALPESHPSGPENPAAASATPADAASAPVPDTADSPPALIHPTPAAKSAATSTPRASTAGKRAPARGLTAPSASESTFAAETTDTPELAPIVLAVDGLVKRFGQMTAVSGVNLQVRAGSFYGIVGPNGAGKTTTLSMVTGLLRPDAGSIRVHGIDVWAKPIDAKRVIGVLPDRLRLFDRLTGAQLLHYAGVLRGLDGATVRARSADLAAAFGLEDALNRLVADYSAGMTKKIALACAMIHSPRVLVLDEPFESVDPVSAVNVTEILQKYVASGGTVLLSSHGMDMIQRVCDHVAIIVQGQVLASGTVDDVRGKKSLEDRFVELAGGRKVAEGMEWLHSFSD